MKRTRFSEEQIAAILKQGEAGMKTAELCRQNSISEATYYNWKAKYGGLAVSDLCQDDYRSTAFRHVNRLNAPFPLRFGKLADGGLIFCPTRPHMKETARPNRFRSRKFGLNTS